MSRATQQPTESPAKKAKLTSETKGDEVSYEKRKPINEDEFFNDGVHEMTDKDWDLYEEAIDRSRGFDVPFFPDVYEIGLIHPAPQGWPAEDIREHAEFAVKYHNEKMKKEGGNELRLKDVIKCNLQAAGPLNYYITFRAQDVITGEIDEYEALALTHCTLEDKFPIFRRKTKPTNPPAPEEVEHGSSFSNGAIEYPKQSL